eukprot:m.107901 g.107901  ORF g.107901 m.107901 type:complete len:57 (-) comp10638_c0_seq2:1368-1538(-)
MGKGLSLVVAVSSGFLGGLYIAQNYSVPSVVEGAKTLKTMAEAELEKAKKPPTGSQ